MYGGSDDKKELTSKENAKQDVIEKKETKDKEDFPESKLKISDPKTDQKGSERNDETNKDDVKKTLDDNPSENVSPFKDTIEKKQEGTKVGKEDDKKTSIAKYLWYGQGKAPGDDEISEATSEQSSDNPNDHEA